MHFPWGSLLRGVLGYDDAVLAGMAAMLAPDARVSVLLSVVPRDGQPAVPPLDVLTTAYARHGLSLIESRQATADEVAGSHSSWAKRLRAAASRPVTLLQLRGSSDGATRNGPGCLERRAGGDPPAGGVRYVEPDCERSPRSGSRVRADP